MTKINEEILEETVVTEAAAEVVEEVKPAKRTRKTKKTEEAVAEGAEEKPAKKTRKTAKKAEEAAEGEEKPVKKTASRKKAAAVKANVNLQFAGKEYTTEKLIEIAKDVWQYDLGRDAAEFKSVELYVKTEESSVYYVINEEVTGSFAI